MLNSKQTSGCSVVYRFGTRLARCGPVRWSVAVLIFAAGPLFALNPALPPGKNFDLSHWYLGLPDADSSSIDASKLTKGYTNAAWFYTGADGAMVFYTPVNGGTTPNSVSPRTELREQISPGSNSDNWTSPGTHILEAQCKILQVPSSGQFWIGQIHGYLNNAPALFLLRYDHGLIQAQFRTNPAVYGSIYLPLTNVATNELIFYRIHFSDGLLTASVNGATQRIDVAASNPNWTNQTFYFKAGSYCDDNLGPATEGSRVAFYKLNATHSPYSAPTITLAPVSQASDKSTSVAFRAMARGSTPLTFRWRRNGLGIPSATSSNLVLTNITLAHAGDYSVLVSNLAGTVVSSNATLVVVPVPNQVEPPVIAQGPVNQETNRGSTVRFHTLVTGASPLFFQWHKDGAPLLASTNSLLVLSNTVFANAGLYHCVITNAFGSVTSALASLRFIAEPPPVLAIRMEAGKVRLQWTILPGRNYRVYARSEFHEGEWSELATPVVFEGTLASCEDQVSAPQRFFRVVME